MYKDTTYNILVFYVLILISAEEMSCCVFGLLHFILLIHRAIYKSQRRKKENILL